MTDKEMIVKLATGIHGWTVKENQNTGNTIAILPDNCRLHLSGDRPVLRVWTPFESWDDVMALQDKMLAGTKANEYVLRIYDGIVQGITVIGTQRLYRSLLTATPRQRCEAMVAALEDRQ